MKPLKAYDIQFVGLKLGKHIYDYEINQTFFEYFEFDEFNTINVNLNIHLELVGVLYILDEPSIGLHQRDNEKLINSLKILRDLGNSVIVVEHDKDMIEQADLIIDIGPYAG